MLNALKRKSNVFDQECSICYESPSYNVVTPCNHLFCAKCIYTWAAQNDGCPLCRRELGDDIRRKSKDYCIKNHIYQWQKIIKFDFNNFIGHMVECYIIGCDLFNTAIICSEEDCECTHVFNDIETFICEIIMDIDGYNDKIIDYCDMSFIHLDLMNTCHMYVNLCPKTFLSDYINDIYKPELVLIKNNTEIIQAKEIKEYYFKICYQQ